LTFLMYLNNVPAGGETTFPYVGMNIDPVTNPIPCIAYIVLFLFL